MLGEIVETDKDVAPAMQEVFCNRTGHIRCQILLARRTGGAGGNYQTVIKTIVVLAKTTIVKILSTLLKQDSGNATVNGFDVESKPHSVRQSISLTGQFAAVDEVLTGRENVIMIARLRHLSNPRQVASDLL